jgi:hypothetical protein
MIEADVALIRRTARPALLAVGREGRFPLSLSLSLLPPVVRYRRHIVEKLRLALFPPAYRLAVRLPFDESPGRAGARAAGDAADPGRYPHGHGRRRSASERTIDPVCCVLSRCAVPC